MFIQLPVCKTYTVHLNALKEFCLFWLYCLHFSQETRLIVHINKCHLDANVYKVSVQNPHSYSETEIVYNDIKYLHTQKKEK